jgi:hypothetical protein
MVKENVKRETHGRNETIYFDVKKGHLSVRRFPGFDRPSFW